MRAQTILASFAVCVAACTPVGFPAPPSPPDLTPPSPAAVLPDLPPPSSAVPPAIPDPPPDVVVPEPPRPPSVTAPLSVTPALSAMPALEVVNLPLNTGNVRALWVVRTALLHPDSARAAVRRAREAGFNTLLVQVRGRGDAYYDSQWEPRPDGLAAEASGYDPLGTVLEEAALLGLAVHAWVNVHLVASAAYPPSNPEHLVRSEPELLAVPRDLAKELFARNPRDPSYLNALLRYTRAQGDRLEGLFTSPANPLVQDHLIAVVRDLVQKYPLAGIHFDYLRYPTAEFDYSRGALEAFRLWTIAQVAEGADGAESRWPDDPLAYVAAFPGLWEEFRVAQVSRTAQALAAAAKEIAPELVVSAAVHPDPDEALARRFQDWVAWLEDGTVDVAAPMIYTGGEAVFLSQLGSAAVADPRRIWAGVGVYQDTFETAVGKARAARATGVGGIAVFSYDWAVGPAGAAVGRGSYLTRFGEEVWGADR